MWFLWCVYCCERRSYCYRVNNNSKKYRPLAFKNNVPFTNCISKINNVLIDNAGDLDNVLIDNAGDLDVVMPMYNLIEYSRKTTEVCGVITEMN